MSTKVQRTKELCGDIISVTAEATINAEGEIELVVYACSGDSKRYSANIIETSGSQIHTTVTGSGILDAFDEKPVSCKARCSRLSDTLQNRQKDA